jgi:hypothetical protein
MVDAPNEEAIIKHHEKYNVKCNNLANKRDLKDRLQEEVYFFLLVS